MENIDDTLAMQKPFELPEIEKWRTPEAVRAQMAYRSLVEKALITKEVLPVAVPEGWKLVPIEPTRQMMSQGHFAMAGTDRGKFRRIYIAMIAASPEFSE